MDTLRFVSVKKWAEKVGVDEGMISAIEEYAKDGSISKVQLCGSESMLIDLTSLEEFLVGMSDKVSVSSFDNDTDTARGRVIEVVRHMVDGLGHRSVAKKRYVNLYARSSANRVYGQLHLPKAVKREEYGGVFFIVPNGDIFDFTSDHFHTDASLLDLEGDHGPNASWLRGDGIRGTTSQAQIYLLPLELLENETDDRWEELKSLIETAQKARE